MLSILVAIKQEPLEEAPSLLGALGPQGGDHHAVPARNLQQVDTSRNLPKYVITSASAQANNTGRAAAGAGNRHQGAGSQQPLNVLHPGIRAVPIKVEATADAVLDAQQGAPSYAEPQQPTNLGAASARDLRAPGQQLHRAVAAAANDRLMHVGLPQAQQQHQPQRGAGAAAAGGLPSLESLLDGMSVVPAWDQTRTHLTLSLHPLLAASCSGVRVELGGVLLPAYAVKNLRLEGQGWGDQYALRGRGAIVVKKLLDGAQLHACKAVVSADGSWELVLAGAWPLAPTGQKGGIDALNAYTGPPSMQLVPPRTTGPATCLACRLFYDMGILPATAAPPASFSCMAAVQLNGRLLPFQQQVEIRQAKTGALTYYMKGCHGLAGLLQGGQLQGYRWLRLRHPLLAAPAGYQQGGGPFIPGLFVIALTCEEAPAQEGAGTDAQEEEGEQEAAVDQAPGDVEVAGGRVMRATPARELSARRQRMREAKAARRRERKAARRLAQQGRILPQDPGVMPGPSAVLMSNAAGHQVLPAQGPAQQRVAQVQELEEPAAGGHHHHHHQQQQQQGRASPQRWVPEVKLEPEQKTAVEEQQVAGQQLKPQPPVQVPVRLPQRPGSGGPMLPGMCRARTKQSARQAYCTLPPAPDPPPAEPAAVQQLQHVVVQQLAALLALQRLRGQQQEQRLISSPGQPAAAVLDLRSDSERQRQPSFCLNLPGHERLQGPRQQQPGLASRAGVEHAAVQPGAAACRPPAPAPAQPACDDAPSQRQTLHDAQQPAEQVSEHAVDPPQPAPVLLPEPHREPPSLLEQHMPDASQPQQPLQAVQQEQAGEVDQGPAAAALSSAVSSQENMAVGEEGCEGESRVAGRMPPEQVARGQLKIGVSATQAQDIRQSAAVMEGLTQPLLITTQQAAEGSIQQQQGPPVKTSTAAGGKAPHKPPLDIRSLFSRKTLARKPPPSPQQQQQEEEEQAGCQQHADEPVSSAQQQHRLCDGEQQQQVKGQQHVKKPWRSAQQQQRETDMVPQWQPPTSPPPTRPPATRQPASDRRSPVTVIRLTASLAVNGKRVDVQGLQQPPRPRELQRPSAEPTADPRGAEAGNKRARTGVAGSLHPQQQAGKPRVFSLPARAQQPQQQVEHEEGWSSGYLRAEDRASLGVGSRKRPWGAS